MVVTDADARKEGGTFEEELGDKVSSFAGVQFLCRVVRWEGATSACGVYHYGLMAR